jgi:hypothetical protein
MKKVLFILLITASSLTLHAQNRNPGQKDQKDGYPTDEPVHSYFTFGRDTVYIINTHIADYVYYDTLPGFPGGFDKLSEALNKNLVYPPDALKNNIQGKVFITMIVKKDGTIMNVKAIRGPSQDLIQEAVRLVGLSPKWNPAMLGNNPINCEYTVALTFSISPLPKITAGLIRN